MSAVGRPEHPGLAASFIYAIRLWLNAKPLVFQGSSKPVWRIHVRARLRRSCRLSLAALALAVSVLVLLSRLCRADAASTASPPQNSQKSARASVKLPGLVIDLHRRCVDLEGRICLDAGLLELVACTEGTKEHESILSVSARAMHIHTALLLLGADNGHPVMSKPLDKEQTRWTHLPARGDEIEVFLVATGKNGKPVERPISDFIIRSRERVDEVDGVILTAPDENRKQDDRKKESRLPHTFVFAGSHLHEDGSGPRQYLADASGNVISIATFGDEVLCLPFHETQQDGALMWRIKPKSLPKVGTKVTLRLRPKQKPAKPSADERTKSSNAEPAGDGAPVSK